MPSVSIDPAATASLPATAPYVMFRLGEELFAIEVAFVREVLELTPMTRLPQAPPDLRGVVNVRGTAIAVVDLRAKFGLPAVPDTLRSRILVVELPDQGETRTLGGLADSVQDVIEISRAELRPPPTTGLRWRAEMIRGLCRRNDDFVIVLDAAAVFTERLADPGATPSDPLEQP